MFLILERTRTSRVWVDGVYVGTQNSLCTSHRYDITSFVTRETCVITIMIDNVSCPVPGGHMTSPDTQTNWLGITGAVVLERLAKTRLERIRIIPHVNTCSVTVEGNLVGSELLEVTAYVPGFVRKTVTLSTDYPSFEYSMDGALLWNEHNPVLYDMTLSVGEDETVVTFGLREYTTDHTAFLLNGEKIFLRGKHDGLLFPLTGAAPTDVEEWKRILQIAKDHGINHYRFHTCCPPEAAFVAADEVGIYMEPELPFWGTVEDEITPAQQYLIDEGFRILDAFANHPSFFALSLGNELWGSQERLNQILGDYKAWDSRPLYTQGSNNFQFWPCILDNDDFFVGVRFSKERLFRGSYAMCDAPLGHIQTETPNTTYHYDSIIQPGVLQEEGAKGGTTLIQYGTGVKEVSLDNAGGAFISHVPVVSHEVGQYFMYPNYREMSHYTGVLKPYNMEIFRERLADAGMLSLAEDFFQASGHLAADCYKYEIETALRSRTLSGFQLLDLQDFTGQGTALVGILNALMENKGIISPSQWKQFCAPRVLLGCLPKFVYTAGETVSLDVKLYQYGANPDVNPTIDVTLEMDGDVSFFSTLSTEGIFQNGVFDLGTIELQMPELGSPKKAILTLRGDALVNTYSLWIYPQYIGTSDNGATQTCFVTHNWQIAKEALNQGGSVLYFPKKLTEENSIEGTYCTDFWNYPMFASISRSMNKPEPVGTLGLLIDTEHPALAQFPTEYYSTPQWYDIVTASRTMILDGTGLLPIVRTIDNCERNHNLGTIFETKVGTGKLLVCTADLTAQETSPACRQLLLSLTAYVSGHDFAPKGSLTPEEADKLWG